MSSTNHFISLAKAKEMTAKFRAEKENILLSEFRNLNILSICETFDRSAFDTVLAETGCVSVRVYFGMTPEMKIRLIIVGVNDKNQDILPSGEAALAEAGNIVEEGQPCPPFCPPPPPL